MDNLCKYILKNSRSYLICIKTREGKHINGIQIQIIKTILNLTGLHEVAQKNALSTGVESDSP